MRHLLLAAFLLAWPAQALSQQSTVLIDRGLTDDPPYTLIYPSDLKSIDDGSPLTVTTLQMPNSAFQCDVLVRDEAARDWSAQGALQTFDRTATEGPWSMRFPGFVITVARLVEFQSGPALFYEANSADSPYGIPAKVFHAEAVDQGRKFSLECVMDLGIAEEARRLVEFLIANFSTRSDGECCINPHDDRG